MTKKKPTEPSFEEALKTLETLVDKLETGDMSLEESLKVYEDGVALTRRCQAALDLAEQKIMLLNDNSDTPVPFNEQ